VKNSTPNYRPVLSSEKALHIRRKSNYLINERKREKYVLGPQRDAPHQDELAG
jgi:hypothetical protein